jgi:hypothetical protein
MPPAVEVRPKKWSHITVLFDDDVYSVIAGIYNRGDHRVLGERWNGEPGKPGFPSQGGHPTYHVIPDFLKVPVLHGLLDELAKTPGQPKKRHDAIRRELSK